MKKIGIMGAQGTGKTTLALSIAALIKNDSPQLSINILPEVARNAPGQLNEKSTIDNQRWIHYMQYCVEIKTSMYSDTLICDRTVLDSLIYAIFLGYNDLAKDCMKNALAWMGTYDTLYWLRPDKEPFDDGVRSADRDFQKKIDLLFAQNIYHHNIITKKASDE